MLNSALCNNIIDPINLLLSHNHVQLLMNLSRRLPILSLEYLHRSHVQITLDLRTLLNVAIITHSLVKLEIFLMKNKRILILSSSLHLFIICRTLRKPMNNKNNSKTNRNMISLMIKILTHINLKILIFPTSNTLKKNKSLSNNMIRLTMFKLFQI